MLKNEFIARSVKLFGTEQFDYTYIIDDEISMISVITLKCLKCGYIFNTTVFNHLHSPKGCSHCNKLNYEKHTGRLDIKRKFHDRQSFFDEVKKVQPDYIDISQITEYVNDSGYQYITCLKHNIEYMQRNDSLYKGKLGCYICGVELKSQSKTKDVDDFIEKSIEIFGKDRFSYTKVKESYKNRKSIVSLYCNIHRCWFEVSCDQHLFEKHGGCKKCVSDALRNGRLLDSNEYKLSWNAIFKGKYVLVSEYINQLTNIKVKCTLHNVEFECSPQVIYNIEDRVSELCPMCEYEKRFNEFKSRAMKIHPEYKYLRIFTKDNKHLYYEAECPIHGNFISRADNLLNHNGRCYKCSRIIANNKSTISLEEQIKNFQKIHGDKYKYLRVYTDDRTNKRMVEYECPEHGIIQQRIDGHMKCGCKYCKESKLETRVKVFFRTT